MKHMQKTTYEGFAENARAIKTEGNASRAVGSVADAYIINSV